MILKKNKYILTALSAVSFLSTGLLANENSLKSTIKANGQINYFTKQQNAENFKEMFAKGNFYGRLRNNNFYYWYEDKNENTHFVSALGASLMYKSASYNNFNFTLGAYGSRAFFSKSKSEVDTLKSGKDLFSRYDYVTTGSKSLYTFAQANIAYRFSKTELSLGRQLVETFYTKSNDTKMIPNSFDGMVIASQDISDTTFKLAYLAKEKLRDHQNAHSVLVYGDSNATASARPEWSQNDDSAMHKGLTYSALKNARVSTDAPLIVIDAQNNSIDDLKVNIAAYCVPKLLSQAMFEANYNIKFGHFNVAPGVRYLHQFDNGAGDIGGASLTGKIDGYNDPNSLDAQMIAARVVTKVENYKINLGYTNILNKADLVTPWRGFPTAGYTRSMGIYNWRGNTKSYRAELVKGDNKTGIYDSFIQTSVLYIDGDQNKSEKDRMFYYFGYIKNLASAPEFQYRFRLGYSQFIGDSTTTSDYADARLEFNYTF